MEKVIKKKLKMPKKIIKKIKKKEELPSFLRNLSHHDFDRKNETPKELDYSNPIFFGECKQFHGIPHPVVLGGFSRLQGKTISEESLNFQFFFSKGEKELLKEASKPTKARDKRKHAKEFIDQYPHRCPGVKKAFVPDVKIFTPDFGETSSEIESDTWREIPLRCVKRTFSEESSNLQTVLLSDLVEKTREYLPYEQRMAHNHFPKEFITVRLIGPVIPASITITKIPSKRKTMSNLDFDVKKKTVKFTKDQFSNIAESEKTKGKEEESIAERKEEIKEEQEKAEIDQEKLEKRPDEEQLKEESGEELRNGEPQAVPSNMISEENEEEEEEEEEEVMIVPEEEKIEEEKIEKENIEDEKQE